MSRPLHGENGELRLTPQDPWPGLPAFTAENSRFFFGREEEIKDIFRRVRRQMLTVLFGVSGLGKTSLLQAGLLPQLGGKSFHPIYIRLKHGLEAGDLVEQLRATISREMEAAKLDGRMPGVRSPEKEENLWSYLHDRTVLRQDARGESVRVVLVFDQFEEIFTAEASGRETESRRRRLLETLACLVENRPPEALARASEDDVELAERYDFRRDDYRVVISLREDFLAHLENLKQQMPSVMENRMRLQRMKSDQALQAVLGPGKEIVEPAVAWEIVEFVAGRGRERQPGDPGSEDDGAGGMVTVEPALLSLVCYELNRQRQANSQEHITADLLTEQRAGIIEGFYERAFEGVDERVRDWVEAELLTASGYRRQAALEDALERGLPASGFEQLEQLRILHREKRDGVVWLELLHDLLARPAADSRKLRRAQELEQSQRKAMRQAEEQMQKDVDDLRRERRDLTGRTLTLLTDLLARSKRDLDQYGTSAVLQRGYVQLLATAADIFSQNGHYQQAAGCSRNALALVEHLEGVGEAQNVIRLTRAEALCALADSLAEEGRGAEASAHFSEVLELASVPVPGPLDQDWTRVGILAKLGLGKVSNRLYEYERAARYFHEVADAPVEAGSDEHDGQLSYWKIRALLGLCHEQEAKAPLHAREAGSQLAQLIRRFPDDLRWQELSAELGCVDGASLLEVGDLPRAEKTITGALAASRLLNNRNPQNLEWSLALVHSHRRSGEYHKQRGDFARATEAFGQMGKIAGTVEASQPDCLRPRYQGTVAKWLLACVAGESAKAHAANARGNLVTAEQAQKFREDGMRLREEAWIGFSAARDEFKEIAHRAPFYPEHHRSVALAIWKQIELISDFRDDDGAQPQHSALDSERHKELLTLWHDRAKERIPTLYSEGLTALEAPGVPQNAGRIIEIKWHLHWLFGNTLKGPGNFREAISAHEKAVATAVELVRLTPEPKVYKQLSETYALLAYTLSDAGDLAGAIASFRLGTEAIETALRTAGSDNTGLLAQKAQTEREVAEMWWRQRDLDKTLASLSSSVRTILSARADGLNLDLTEKLRDLHQWATSALEAAVRECGSDELRQRNATLLDECDTAALLMPGGSIIRDNILKPASPLNWPWRPLVPGCWRTLGAVEQREVIRQFAELHPGLKEGSVLRVRQMRLDCYDEGNFYEAEVRQTNGLPATVCYVSQGKNRLLLDGKSSSIYELNNRAPIRLDDVQQANAYLRLFCGAVGSTDGTFKLVDDVGDLHFAPHASPEIRQRIIPMINPLVIEDDPSRAWRASATVQYSDAIYYASFSIDRSGVVRMRDDAMVASKLPVFSEQFAGGLRVIKSFQQDELMLRERLALDPKDEAALAALSELYLKAKRPKEAVEARLALMAQLRDSATDERVRGEYVSLSWYQLMARDFAGALASAEAGLAIDHSFLMLETNRAHALLFLGREQEAEQLYLGHRGQTVETRNVLWENLIVADFDEFAAEGITHPEIARIRALLKGGTQQVAR